jgi:hypothetical protein
MDQSDLCGVATSVADVTHTQVSQCRDVRHPRDSLVNVSIHSQRLQKCIALTATTLEPGSEDAELMPKITSTWTKMSHRNRMGR